MRMAGPGLSDEVSNVGLKLRAHLEKGGRLFVRNATVPRNIIHLSWVVPGSPDRGYTNIADTFLPIEITRHVAKDDLLRSDDFWKYIEGGHLVPMKASDALEELSTEDADEERMRLKGNKASSLGYKAQDFAKVAARRANPQTQVEEEEYEPEVKLNRKAVSIAGRLQMGTDGGISSGMALAELRNIPELTRDDLAYLVGNGTFENTATGKTDARVSDWALEALGKLRTPPAAPTKTKKKVKAKKKASV